MRTLKTISFITIIVLTCDTLALAATFGPAVVYDVGDSPHRICAADFDDDGDLDLAITRYNSDYLPEPDPTNALLIMKNNGDGSFAAPVVYDVGEEPIGICTADVDSDGDIDIVIANYAPGVISVLKNDGDASFSLTSTCPTSGNYCRSLCAADFNGDSHIDLAVLSSVEDSVCILLNDSDGAFARDTAIAIGEYPNWVCSGDFDSDGDQDLAATYDWSAGISIFLNNGNARFVMDAIHSVGTDPYTIVVGDVNNDGHQDLAVAVQTSDKVTVMINNGDASFQMPSDVATVLLPVSLCLADFDGDTYADIAVTCHIRDSIYVLTNNGDGTFALDTKCESEGSPICVTSGDFDGDGKPDLAAVSYLSDQMSIFFNTTILSDIGDEHVNTDIPASFQLRQNYPNPFNPSTTLEFDLPQRAHVEMTIYNIGGQMVRHLVNEELPAGTHLVEWDSKNDHGEPVATGIYLCHFKAGDITAVKKMALLK